MSVDEDRQPFDDPALNWTCGYSPDGPLECLDDAVWHGFKLTDDGRNIKYMMASCGGHLSNMRARVDWIHAMQSACGLAGSRFMWPENVCYVEWDADGSALVGAVDQYAEVKP